MKAKLPLIAAAALEGGSWSSISRTLASGRP